MFMFNVGLFSLNPVRTLRHSVKFLGNRFRSEPQVDQRS